MSKERLKKRKVLDLFLGILPYLMLLFVVVFFIVATEGRILKPINIKTIFGQIVVLLLVTTGTVFIFAQGNIDLSIGVTVGITCLVATLTINFITDNLLVIMAVCIVVSMLIKTVIGIVIAKFRLPFFLATLVIQVILNAFLSFGCYTFNTSTTDTSSISIPHNSSIIQYDNVWFRLICVAVVVALCIFLLHYKRMGKYCKALGGNVECSKQAGVNRGKYVIYSFMFSGFATGLAALLYLLRIRQVAPSTGSGMQLSAIIAVVLGGMSLKGGARTKAMAPIIGGLTYAILDYGMVMIQVPGGVIQGIRALVFLVIIGVYSLRERNSNLPR